MKLDPTVIVAVITSLVSLVSVIITGRYAARAARAARDARDSAQKELATKVDAQAFHRARESYDAALKVQKQQIADLTQEMNDEAAECRRKIHALQGDMRALGEWARPLLRAARAAGIRHPEPPVWLDNAVEDTEGLL